MDEVRKVEDAVRLERATRLDLESARCDDDSAQVERDTPRPTATALTTTIPYTQPRPLSGLLIAALIHAFRRLIRLRVVPEFTQRDMPPALVDPFEEAIPPDLRWPSSKVLPEYARRECIRGDEYNGQYIPGFVGVEITDYGPALSHAPAADSVTIPTKHPRPLLWGSVVLATHSSSHSLALLNAILRLADTNTLLHSPMARPSHDVPTDTAIDDTLTTTVKCYDDTWFPPPGLPDPPTRDIFKPVPALSGLRHDDQHDRADSKARTAFGSTYALPFSFVPIIVTKRRHLDFNPAVDSQRYTAFSSLGANAFRVGFDGGLPTRILFSLPTIVPNVSFFSPRPGATVIRATRRRDRHKRHDLLRRRYGIG